MNEQLQHKSTTWQAATQALLLKQTAIKQPTIKAPTPKSLDTRAAPPTNITNIHTITTTTTSSAKEPGINRTPPVKTNLPVWVDLPL
jgi:hypothetical protein